MKKLVVILVIAVLLLSACTPPPKDRPTPTPVHPNPKPSPNPTPSPGANGNTILGVEYAFPGQAQAFSELGITGVKFYPEKYTMWDAMQSGPSAQIDFSELDAMVKEYQAAGFSDILFGLRHQSTWGSIDAGKFSQKNALPKPEYQDEYETWFRSVVERYDKDGIDDMPGLMYPINRYEIGVEFSTYEPESASEYVVHLDRAYKIAHEANKNAQVAHVAFLTLGALDRPVSSSQYESSFATQRDKVHGLEDMRVILDHPESFDLLNVHSLGDPTEIPRMKEFFTSEMKKRGYTKPIIISDTSPTPFISYGPADTCTGNHGAIFYPATEADLCRTADYFKKLIADDPESVAFVRSFIAQDTVKRAVIASEQGVVQVDLAFTEDFNAFLFKKLLHAGTGNAAWGGFLDTSIKAGSEQRTVNGKFPSFYALKQLQSHLAGYSSIKRLDKGSDVFAYEVKNGSKTFYIAWLDTGKLILPGDEIPSKTISLGTGSVTVEQLITKQGETTPESSAASLDAITLTPSPVFILP